MTKEGLVFNMLSGKDKLIGRGKAAKVYKIAEGPRSLVRKEFSPIYPVRLWNWFFYKSLHPLDTEPLFWYNSHH